MRQFTLVLIHTDNDEVKDLVSKHLRDLGFSILPDVFISWQPRQKIEERLVIAKEELIDMIERGFKGELAYAIIELNDEQFRAIRPLIARRLEDEDQRMISWGEALLRRIRSSHREKSKREYSSFNRRYKWLITMHELFDVKHELLKRVLELARELRIEYERNFK
ncbi:hypothetical protein [Vulcanisaeta souniana]|uniref:Uncharacterized protein n=1 Tax=Vulcanisaeta souniana JCM 11219 TaxID=1293586 RepID=A0A830E6A7_9CREN|nr:hypothetical protein [Vulcanisaeta souniana]BDR92172.1 hypothetical protein Vsou_12650 [Vulcanisaeta souniana JCM 11219]GGI67357.1 hypothetical protein GCM10007112_00440 [Vulcanisaeta souniana JCM 11219]